MTRSQEPLPFVGKIVLLIGVGLILFACGLCLGAVGTVLLTRPASFLPSSGSAGSSLDHPAPPGTAVLAGDVTTYARG